MKIRRLKMRFPEGKNKALTLSYDDGNIRDRRLVSLMRSYGIKGTFNLNSGYMPPEADTSDAHIGWQQMTAEQCREVYGTDMEIAIHGRTHPWLESIPTAEAVAQVIEDRIALEALSGLPVRGGAYPYGTYNDDVVEILRLAGIAYCRTTKRTGGFELPTDLLRLKPTAHHTDPDLMELAREFLSDDAEFDFPKLFYLWGHAFEFEKNDNWALIEDFFRLTGGRDDVFYATNIAIVDYMKAFEALQFDVRHTVVRNPTCTDVFVATKKETLRIPAGQTVKLPE